MEGEEGLGVGRRVRLAELRRFDSCHSAVNRVFMLMVGLANGNETRPIFNGENTDTMGSKRLCKQIDMHRSGAKTVHPDGISSILYIHRFCE